MKQSISLKTKSSIIILCFIYLIFSTIISSETEIISSKNKITPSKTEWTVFIIAQTKGNPPEELSIPFFANIGKVTQKAMGLSGFNERLNVLVQWECPETEIKIEQKEKAKTDLLIILKEGIKRYNVTKRRLQFLQNSPFADYPEKIVDFVRWGVANYPSKHIAIIFSGHGSGIIDPAPHEIKDFIPKKGILLNMEDKTYLNNQMLIETMQQINKILGKKIDLIGMDACLMGDIETLYQMKDYVKIFVGSEELEPAYGWPYSEIFKEFASRSLTPFELANIIVSTYGSYYQNRLNWHTQSAINLEKINDLKNNLDQIITHLQECKRLHGYVIRKTVRETKGRSLGFLKQWNEKRQKYYYLYVDLASFYSELHKNIQNLPTSEPIEKLKKCLIDGIKLIETIVIANVTGKDATQAKGISIYYPPYYLYPHFSYYGTKFAQESLWPEFLERIA